MQDRLKEFMDIEGFNARELSERIGVQASSVSHILTGRNKPSLDFLEKMLKSFPDMDLKYLISGLKRTESKDIIKEKSPEVQHEVNIDNQSFEDKDKGRITNVISDDQLLEIVMFFENGTFERFRQKMS